MTEENLSFKWSTKRVFPNMENNVIVNVTTLNTTAKYKIDSLEEWIGKEMEIQKDIFEGMHVDKILAQKAMDALKEAYESTNSK